MWIKYKDKVLRYKEFLLIGVKFDVVVMVFLEGRVMSFGKRGWKV